MVKKTWRERQAEKNRKANIKNKQGLRLQFELHNAVRQKEMTAGQALQLMANKPALNKWKQEKGIK